MVEEYSTFKEKLAAGLEEELAARGHDVRISDQLAHKTNGDQDGLTVTLSDMGREGISPTLYTGPMYEQYRTGMEMQDLISRVADSAEAAYTHMPDVPTIDKDYVKENAYLVVCNTEMNEELLSTVPHEEIEGTDLSYYARCRVDDEASFAIRNDLCANLHMTQSELLETARANTIDTDRYDVRSMTDVMREMMPAELCDGMFPMEEETPSMVVISNHEKIDGAQAILSTDTLDRAAEMLDSDKIAILPSSRHELLAVNPEAMGMEDTAGLKDMVMEVNATQVERQDFLSDNVYQYNAQTHELEMCNEMGHFEEHDEPEQSVSIRRA